MKAPKGHIILQKPRSLDVMSPRTKSSSTILIINGTTSGTPLIKAHGIADWRVPGGHILQKKKRESVPQKKGTAKTVNSNTKYLEYSNRFEIVILCEGILYKSSWNKPKGQAHPQKSLPNKTPNNIRIPKIKKGNKWRALNCPKTPIGQANIAIGQEWQFSTGMQNDLISKNKEELSAISENTWIFLLKIKYSSRWSYEPHNSLQLNSTWAKCPQFLLCP